MTVSFRGALDAPSSSSIHRTPMSDQTVSLRPKPMNILLAIAGAIGFVVMGAILILSGGVKGLLAGALSVGFFGHVAVLAEKALRKPRGLDLKPDGLWVRGPSYAPKRVPWSAVEALGVYAMDRQKFNVVALSDPAGFLAQFDPAEAEATVTLMRRMFGFAVAAAPLAAASGDRNAAEAARFVAGSRTGDLAAVFASMRELYGGEILLGWADRDRSAEELDALLSEWSAKYGGDA